MLSNSFCFKTVHSATFQKRREFHLCISFWKGTHCTVEYEKKPLFFDTKLTFNKGRNEEIYSSPTSSWYRIVLALSSSKSFDINYFRAHWFLGEFRHSAFHFNNHYFFNSSEELFKLFFFYCGIYSKCKSWFSCYLFWILPTCSCRIIIFVSQKRKFVRSSEILKQNQ